MNGTALQPAQMESGRVVSDWSLSSRGRGGVITGPLASRRNLPRPAIGQGPLQGSLPRSRMDFILSEGGSSGPE
jgi:hypothetical protein